MTIRRFHEAHRNAPRTGEIDHRPLHVPGGPDDPHRFDPVGRGEPHGPTGFRLFDGDPPEPLRTGQFARWTFLILWPLCGIGLYVVGNGSIGGAVVGGLLVAGLITALYALVHRLSD